MIRIAIGVNDIIHGGMVRGKKTNSILTTGKLAKKLEKNYSLFSGWADNQQNFIRAELMNAVARSIPDKNLDRRLLTQATIRIGRQMQNDVVTGKVERMKLGPHKVPTRAALMGVNNRFKSGFNNRTPAQIAKQIARGQEPRGDRRWSFNDTGVFARQITAWVVAIKKNQA